MSSEEINPELENRFSYHPIESSEQQKKYESIRNSVKELAYLISETVPNSREQAVALTKLEEVMFAANSGIARRS